MSTSYKKRLTVAEIRYKNEFNRKNKLNLSNDEFASLLAQQSQDEINNSNIGTEDTTNELSTNVDTGNPNNLNGFQNAVNRLDNTGEEISYNLHNGVYDFVEHIIDLGAGLVGTVAGWAGNKDVEQGAEDFIKYDWSKAAAKIDLNVEYLAINAMSGENIFSGDYWDLTGDSIEEYEKNLYNTSLLAYSPDWLHNGVNELAQTVGNMIPSIALGIATGGTSTAGQIATKLGTTVDAVSKAVSVGSMSLSAAGQGTEEALQDGADSLGKATAYGAASGAVEGLTEYLGGWLAKGAGAAISKVSGGKVTADLLSKAMPNSVSGWFTQNLSKNFWAGQAKSFVEEGLEEVESDLLNPLIKSIYNGKSVSENYSNKDNISVESLTHSFLMGGISTLVLGGTDVADYARYGKNVYQTRVSMQDNIDAFNDVAKMFDKETLYQKDAEGNVIIDEDNAPVMTKEGAAAMAKFTETKSEYDKSLDKLTQKEKANFLKRVTGTDVNSMIEVSKKSTESAIADIDNKIAEVQSIQDSEGFTKENQERYFDLLRDRQNYTNKLNEITTDAETYKSSFIKDTISEITKDYDINNISKKAVDDIAKQVKEAGFDVNIREAKDVKEFNSYFNNSNAATAQNSSDYDILGAALYDPNTNTILVNPDVKYNRTKTIAHELTHTIQSNKGSWQYIFDSFNSTKNKTLSKTWKEIVKENTDYYGKDTKNINNESVAEMVEKIIDNPKKFKSLLSYTQKSKIGKALADLFNRNKENKAIKQAYSEFLNADKTNENQNNVEAKDTKKKKTNNSEIFKDSDIVDVKKLDSAINYVKNFIGKSSSANDIGKFKESLTTIIDSFYKFSKGLKNKTLEKNDILKPFYNAANDFIADEKHIRWALDYHNADEKTQNIYKSLMASSKVFRKAYEGKTEETKTNTNTTKTKVVANAASITQAKTEITKLLAKTRRIVSNENVFTPASFIKLIKATNGALTTIQSEIESRGVDVVNKELKNKGVLQNIADLVSEDFINNVNDFTSEEPALDAEKNKTFERVVKKANDVIYELTYKAKETVSKTEESSKSTKPNDDVMNKAITKLTGKDASSMSNDEKIKLLNDIKDNALKMKEDNAKALEKAKEEEKASKEKSKVISKDEKAAQEISNAEVYKKAVDSISKETVSSKVDTFIKNADDILSKYSDSSIFNGVLSLDDKDYLSVEVQDISDYIDELSQNNAKIIATIQKGTHLFTLQEVKNLSQAAFNNGKAISKLVDKMGQISSYLYGIDTAKLNKANQLGKKLEESQKFTNNFSEDEWSELSIKINDFYQDVYTSFKATNVTLASLKLSNGTLKYKINNTFYSANNNKKVIENTAIVSEALNKKLSQFNGKSKSNRAFKQLNGSLANSGTYGNYKVLGISSSQASEAVQFYKSLYATNDTAFASMKPEFFTNKAIKGFIFTNKDTNNKTLFIFGNKYNDAKNGARNGVHIYGIISSSNDEITPALNTFTNYFIHREGYQYITLQDAWIGDRNNSVAIANAGFNAVAQYNTYNPKTKTYDSRYVTKEKSGKMKTLGRYMFYAFDTYNNRPQRDTINLASVRKVDDWTSAQHYAQLAAVALTNLGPKVNNNLVDNNGEAVYNDFPLADNIVSPVSIESKQDNSFYAHNPVSLIEQSNVNMYKLSNPLYSAYDFNNGKFNKSDFLSTIDWITEGLKIKKGSYSKDGNIVLEGDFIRSPFSQFGPEIKEVQDFIDSKNEEIKKQPHKAKIKTDPTSSADTTLQLNNNKIRVGENPNTGVEIHGKSLEEISKIKNKFEYTKEISKYLLNSPQATDFLMQLVDDKADLIRTLTDMGVRDTYNQRDAMVQRLRSIKTVAANFVEYGAGILVEDTDKDGNKFKRNSYSDLDVRTCAASIVKDYMQNIDLNKYVADNKLKVKKNTNRYIRKAVEDDLYATLYRYALDYSAVDKNNAPKIRLREMIETQFIPENKDIENIESYIPNSMKLINSDDFNNLSQMKFYSVLDADIKYIKDSETLTVAQKSELTKYLKSAKENYWSIKTVYGKILNVDGILAKKDGQLIKKYLPDFYNKVEASVGKLVTKQDVLAWLEEAENNPDNTAFIDAMEKDNKGNYVNDVLQKEYAGIRSSILGSDSKQGFLQEYSNQLLKTDIDRITEQFGKEKVTTFHKMLLEDNNSKLLYSVNNGLIATKDYNRMTMFNPHYVPTMREMITVEKSMGTSDLPNSLQYANGSDLVIGDLFENMSFYSNKIIRNSVINQVMNDIFNEAKTKNVAGMNISKIQTIDAEGKITNFDVDKDYLRNVDVNTYINDVKKAENGEYEANVLLQAGLDNNLIRFVKINKDGSKVIYLAQMSDKTYNAFTTVPKYNNHILDNIPFISKILQKWNDLFKNLVTSWSPFFTVRNLSRDVFDALLTTENNPAEFLKNIASSWKMIVANDPMWQLYVQSGGTSSGYIQNNTYGDMVKEADILTNKTKTFFQKYSMAKLNFIVEQGTRFTEFRMSYEKYSKTDASHALEYSLLDAANVTTNFSKGGSFAKALNRTLVPFLNAQIQGAAKLANFVMRPRDAKEWASLLLKLLILGVLPELINELMYGSNEDYQALSEYTKESYYLIPVGNGNFLKIPKGRIVGAFNSVTRNIINVVSGKSNIQEALNQVGETVSTNLAPVDLGSGLRTIFSPILDVNSNTTWYGQAIDKQSDLNKRPSERYGTTTGTIAKTIGKMFNVSPNRVQYLLGQYTGILGNVLLPLGSSESANVGTQLLAVMKNGTSVSAISNFKYRGDFYDLRQEVLYNKNDGDTVASLQYNYMTKALEELNTLEDQIDSTTDEASKYTLYLTLRQGYQTAIENTKLLGSKLQNIAINDTTDRFAMAEAYRQAFGSEYALGYYSSSLKAKGDIISQFGVSYDTYYQTYFEIRSLDTKNERLRYINQLKGLSYFGKKLLYKACGGSLNDNEKRSLINYLKRQGLSETELSTLGLASD